MTKEDIRSVNLPDDWKYLAYYGKCGWFARSFPWFNRSQSEEMEIVEWMNDEVRAEYEYLYSGKYEDDTTVNKTALNLPDDWQERSRIGQIWWFIDYFDVFDYLDVYRDHPNRKNTEEYDMIVKSMNAEVRKEYYKLKRSEEKRLGRQLP